MHYGLYTIQYKLYTIQYELYIIQYYYLYHVETIESNCSGSNSAPDSKLEELL